jgi:hypothetical protein
MDNLARLSRAPDGSTPYQFSDSTNVEFQDAGFPLQPDTSEAHAEYATESNASHIKTHLQEAQPEYEVVSMTFSHGAVCSASTAAFTCPA